VISSVEAEDADTCFELRFVDAEGGERSAAPSPATVIRAIFNDKRRLSERLSTDTRALTRAHLPLKIAHDQLSASGRARSFGKGQCSRGLHATRPGPIAWS
jgi:hypothetical protein